MKHQNPSLLEEVLTHSEAQGTDRLVHLIMAIHSDWGNTALPMAKIADEARISLRQAQRAVKSLMEQNYLNRTGGVGRGNVAEYHVNVTPYDPDSAPFKR